VAHADPKETLGDILPLVASRGSRDGTARAYVCRNFSCRAPVAAPAELASALRG
jgi:uncharacterized protein YyaL (SSP411 family)